MPFHKPKRGALGKAAMDHSNAITCLDRLIPELKSDWKPPSSDGEDVIISLLSLRF